MRFEVPQFIEIEDKIFGPLTWKQFVYVAGGFGLATVLFLTTPFFVFVLIGVPIAVLAAALAFYPINNRPFSVFLESAFNYLSGKKLYLWRQKKPPVYEQNIDRGPVTPPPAIFTPPQQSGGVGSLARRLELEAMQKTEE